MSVPIYIRKIEYILPENRVTNADLKKSNPDWNLDLIVPKTGVESRCFVQEGELASDLAFRATLKLLESTETDRDEIGALIFCTQSPDYIMPPNSTLLHARLGLPKKVVAFDFNLACSGFVYGLAIAKSMMESFKFKKVLLITADTYSKYINPKDRSAITLFGDAAAVSLLETSPNETSKFLDFNFGTDGTGGDKFMIKAGGLRHPKSEKTSALKRDLVGNARSEENILMDGRAVLEFSKRDIPSAVKEILSKNGLNIPDLDLVLFHQASQYALDLLNKTLEIPPEKTFSNIRTIGNTVSASLPILIRDAEDAGRLKRGDQILLVAFGVGFSWGCALIKW